MVEERKKKRKYFTNCFIYLNCKEKWISIRYRIQEEVTNVELGTYFPSCDYRTCTNGRYDTSVYQMRHVC